jgi:small subunit ribosomal protein S17
MKQRKEFIGIVKSIGNKQTVIVEVERTSRHPLYKKTVKRTKRFAVHVVDLDIAVGDLVKIGESKPISKRKHFVVVQKLGK